MNGRKKPFVSRWAKKPGALGATMKALRTFSAEEAAELFNEASIAWDHLLHGRGTTTHCDTLGTALNATMVLSEAIDQAAVDVAVDAQLAVVAMQSRYLQHGRFGADAHALRAIPPGLDLYGQLLAFSNPLQLVRAVCEANKRAAEGDALLPTAPAPTQQQLDAPDCVYNKPRQAPAPAPCPPARLEAHPKESPRGTQGEKPDPASQAGGKIC